jgi:hypothetical protein
MQRFTYRCMSKWYFVLKVTHIIASWSFAHLMQSISYNLYSPAYASLSMLPVAVQKQCFVHCQASYKMYEISFHTWLNSELCRHISWSVVINVVSFEVCLKKREYFTWPFWQCAHSLCIGHVLHKLISLKKMPLGTGMKFKPVTSDCPVMLPYQQPCLFKVFKFTPQCKMTMIMNMLSPDMWSL